ncbi:hypothetical protein H4R24_003992 [Coemansia sp. RSA 988]|nr:hypothetical protein H4R24_003992 [Coemansia sp. RSA 988]
MEAHHLFQKHEATKMHWEQGSVFDISWSSDGNLLTASGSREPVRSWRLGRGGHKEGEEHKGLGNDIERLAWCPATQNLNILAAASFERVVHLWDQKAGSVSMSLNTGKANVDISWSNSGKYLAVTSREEGLCIFDIAQPQSPVVSAEYDGIINSIRWSANDQLIFIATHSGAVEVLSWPTMDHITMIPAHAVSCNCIGIDPRGSLLATGSADATMELWNTEDFSLFRTINDYESPLLFTDFSMDGRFVASASDDLEILIHETFSGDLVHRLKLDSLTSALAWHPRNLAFAYGSSASTKSTAKPSVSIFL